MRNRLVLALAGVVCLAAVPGISGYSKKKNADEGRQFQHPLTSDEKILQALNRLTFGPRPGDIRAVKTMGLKKWLDRQLHPERIAENPLLGAKLKTLDSLGMSGNELVRNSPTPQMVRQMVNGQLPFPADSDRRLMLTKLMAKFEERQAKGGDAATAPAITNMQTLSELLGPQQLRAFRQGTPQQRLAAFLALPKEKQDDVIGAMPPALPQS